MPEGTELVEIEKRAFNLKQQGKYVDAAQLFKVVTVSQPNWNDGGAFFNLGFCLEELKEFEEALQAYQLAVSCDPSNAIFEANLKSLQLLIGKRQD